MSALSSDRDLTKLKPEFKNQVDLWLSECPQIFVTEAYRSAERQNSLYKQGLSWIDGYESLGQHQLGLSVDIAFYGDELYPKDHSKWEEVAKVASKYGIDWGYDLWAHTGFIDKPHFQDNEASFVIPPSMPDWKSKALQYGIDRGWTNGDDPLKTLDKATLLELMRKFYEKEVEPLKNKS